MITLFESDTHRNLMFNGFSSGGMIQANQHLIISNGEGMILDPGGHKIHTKLFAELSSIFNISKLKYLFFSHQDPDIVAATNAWLMMTDADAFLPAIWTRFVAHFGVDEMAAKRVTSIPDEGLTITLGGTDLKVIPAHYLHSSGNFQVYDPVSKILYTGDLGASPAAEYAAVEDFDAHVQYMEGFHKRYMPSTKAVKMWVNMVRGLSPDIIAPQHGAVFNTKALADRFVDWADSLTVGADALGDAYIVPN